MFRISVIFLSLLLLCVNGGYSQQTTGTIRGTVTDASGGTVAGVAVTAGNKDTGVAEKTFTDASGIYSFPLLPPGRYTVRAEASGFRTAVQEGTLVRITETAVVNFNLQVGGVNESVTVTGAVSLLQADTSSEGKVIEQETISALPWLPVTSPKCSGSLPVSSPAPTTLRTLASAPRIRT